MPTYLDSSTFSRCQSGESEIRDSVNCERWCASHPVTFNPSKTYILKKPYQHQVERKSWQVPQVCI